MNETEILEYIEFLACDFPLAYDILQYISSGHKNPITIYNKFRTDPDTDFDETHGTLQQLMNDELVTIDVIRKGICILTDLGVLVLSTLYSLELTGEAKEKFPVVALSDEQY